MTREQRNTWILHYKNQHKKLMEKYLLDIKFGKNNCCTLKATFYLSWFIDVLENHCVVQPNRCKFQMGLNFAEGGQHTATATTINSNVPNNQVNLIQFDFTTIEEMYEQFYNTIANTTAYPNSSFVVRNPGDPLIDPTLAQSFEIILEVEYEAANCSLNLSINSQSEFDFNYVALGESDCNCFKPEDDINNCYSLEELCSLKKKIDKLINHC